MPFENENLFLAAIAKYKRGWPGDTNVEAAVRIYDTFIAPAASNRIVLSVFERSRILSVIARYKSEIHERASMGFLDRLTTQGPKADPACFDGVVKEVDRNLRMSAVQYATLEMLRQNAHNRMVLDRQKAALRAGTYGLTTDQVVEHVRGSDMTINFDASEFFSGKFDPGARYLHMWERGSTLENNPYAAKRDVTEQALFCYGGDVMPSDRPYYAGINIGQRTKGAAGCSSYGFSYFILAEAVKERSTFTPSDSFNISSYVISDEALRELKGKIPDSVLAQLTAIKDPARKYKAPDFERVLMDEMGIKDIRVFATINQYTRKEGTEWKKIATLDRMERIVRWFSDQQLKAISEIARDPGNINQPVADYVEAQIHGAVNFSTDVQEMRIARWEVEHDRNCVSNLQQFATKHNITVRYFSLDDLRQRQTA